VVVDMVAAVVVACPYLVASCQDGMVAFHLVDLKSNKGNVNSMHVLH